MRRPRAILHNEHPETLNRLARCFSELGYEVVACSEPAICVIYNGGGSCDKEYPCADLMIVGLLMPRMSGLGLLERQTRHGCRLSVESKAVLCGNRDAATGRRIRNLGCASFSKPFRPSTLAAWARECERRMELKHPLALRRREQREGCSWSALIDGEAPAGSRVAKVVNRSDSGFCLRVATPLAVAQRVDLRIRAPLRPDHLLVRWTRPDGGGCLAGLSRC